MQRCGGFSVVEVADPGIERSCYSKTHTAMSNELPWTERYRVKSVGDLRGQRCIKDLATAVLQNAEETLPNLILYGPSGTGKTTAILALCLDMFGSDNDTWQQRVLFLNASDDRGIQTVRDKIKLFSSNMVSTFVSGKSLAVQKKSFPFKVVVLDEADCLTRDAQAALREVIESTSRNTRYCFVCNFVSRIIAPISSRCHKYHFARIDAENIKLRLLEIAASQGITDNLETIDVIAKHANGDLRKAINFLQASHVQTGISETALADMTGALTGRTLADIVDGAKADGGCQNALNAVRNMISHGCNAGQLLDDLVMGVVDTSVCDFDDERRSSIVSSIAKHASSLKRNSDEYITLLAAIGSAAGVL